MRARQMYFPAVVKPIGSLSWAYAYYPSGSYTTFTSDINRSTSTNFARIFDMVGGSKSGGVTVFRPVHHARGDCSVLPINSLVDAGRGLTPWASFKYRFNPWEVMIPTIRGLLQTEAEVDYGAFAWDDLMKNLPVDTTATARYQAAMPSMRSKANLAVFLWELSDIKRMFQFLPSKHLSYKMRRVKDWREALKYANSQHLSYNFGWKPFVRDIKNTFKGLSDFDARLAKFASNAGKRLTEHRSDSYSQLTSSGVFNPLPELYPGFQWAQTSVERTYTYHCATTVQMTYGIPEYSQNELKVRAYLDTLGLHVNPSNIWAVLPWSFVVDWFVDVGNHLEQYQSDWTQPWIDIHQACTSRKIVEGKGVYTIKCVGCEGSPVLGTFTATVRCYDRTLGLGQLWSTTADALNSDKVRLLGSLFAGRVL